MSHFFGDGFFGREANIMQKPFRPRDLARRLRELLDVR